MGGVKGECKQTFKALKGTQEWPHLPLDKTRLTDHLVWKLNMRLNNITNLI